MSKSLGTGIDPLDEIDAHGADALRFGLLAMSSTQDVRYSKERSPAGPRPREQDVERVAADPAERRRRSSPAPRALRRRGPLDPVAAAARDRERDRQPRRATTSRTPRSSSTASSGPSSATGTSRSSSRGSTTASPRRLGDAALGARAGARARAPDDAVRHRGDLRATCRAAAQGGPLVVVRPFPSRDPALVDEAAEAEIEAAIELTRSLRRWRDLAGVAAGSVLPARVSGDAAPHELVGRLARFSFDGAARRRAARHGRRGGDPRRRRDRRRAGQRGGSRSAATSCAPRSSAPSASSPTTASSPRRPPRSSRPSASKLAAYRAELEELGHSG